MISKLHTKRTYDSAFRRQTKKRNSARTTQSTTSVEKTPERPLTAPASQTHTVSSSNSPASSPGGVTYDQLQQNVVTSAGGDNSAWKTGPNEVNLVGVRSYDDGTTNSGQGNVYNDTIYAVWVDERGDQHVEAFQASTDAGVHDGKSTLGLETSNGGRANSHLADGFYRDSFEISDIPEASNHNGKFDGGLRQTSKVRVQGDWNNDGVISDNEKWGEDLDGDGHGDGQSVDWGWGIMFHPGGRSEGQVNNWSNGCQVIVEEDYARFQEVLETADNQSFSYALIDSSDFLPPSKDQQENPLIDLVA